MQAAPLAGFGSISDRLGWWNLYFIAKLVLFALGLSGFHLVENLFFAAALFAMAGPRARRLRPFIGVPVAIALAWYDSWLPGFSRVVSQAGLVSSFSGAYLAELAARFVNWKALVALGLAAAAFVALRRFVRLDVFVVVAMVALALALGPPNQATPVPAKGAAGGEAGKAPEEILEAFFQQESQRAVAFRTPPDGAAPFDVIFLHVCSLSWDDLEATGLASHPLFAQFDIVLKRFNTVSTYSGPAAIRFLRAPCGQQRHVALYNEPRPQCLLMPGLAQAGLETQVVLNHDGHFDEFLTQVRNQGVQATPQSLSGIAAPQRSFDDSRIYDDAAVLARWLEGRAKVAAPRTAVFYNTVSLHDGNRLAADPSKASAETYKQRLEKLLADLDGFMKNLSASGRRAVVVLVPEHGAALRGDAMQIAGLREIPMPAITLVPVAIKVVGPDAKRNGEAIRLEEPTSYLAISHIVSRMLATPPFGALGFAAGDYTNGTPTTDFVAEGEAAMVAGRGKSYLLKLERDPWRELR